MCLFCDLTSSTDIVQFLCTSAKKMLNFRWFYTRKSADLEFFKLCLIPGKQNKKLLQVLTRFLKLVYYRDYLGTIWRNSKIHDCQPIFENYRQMAMFLYLVFNLHRVILRLGLPRCKNLWSFSLFSSYYFPWIYCAHFSVTHKYNHWKVLFKDVMDSHMPIKTMIVFTLQLK